MHQRRGIAIIGLAGRFPGADSMEEFWTNFLNGKDSVRTPPTDRTYLRDHKFMGGYLNCRLDEFDGDFFDLSDKACSLTDPQQRLFLEVIWESLENAGIPPSSLKGTRTGVYYGTINNEYDIHVSGMVDPKDTLYQFFGASRSAVSGKVSHLLGVHGPSVALESTCVSGAIALHLACQSLKCGESNLALAGGVNIILDQPPLKCPTSILSTNCKSFDESADGLVPAEGCGVFVLKRYEDAVRDGDRIHGIIRGSSSGHDGGDRRIGAPNPAAQELSVRTALEMAGLEPADISMVEIHGTGVRVGDEAEFNSLVRVFANSAENREHPLILGATKCNIGHTGGASTMMSAIKVLNCLKHGVVPQFLHHHNLNPKMNLGKINGVVPLENTQLERRQGRPLIACLNAFGMTGTICHLIIEGGPGIESPLTEVAVDGKPRLVNMSAKTPEALTALIESYKDVVVSSDCTFHDFAASINTTRNHFSIRVSVVANSKEEFVQRISQKMYREGQVSTGGLEKITFLFTDAGAEYSGMAQGLYENSQAFREAFDVAAKSFEMNFQTSLKAFMWAENDLIINNNKSDFGHPRMGNPALLCLQYALFNLWTLGFGIKPDVVIGYGIGEFAAAVAAGFLTFEDALQLVSKRSELVNALPEGAMSVISASVQAVRDLVCKFSEEEPTLAVDIAAVNSPLETVVAGSEDAISLFEDFCSFQRIDATRLQRTHAFNSRAMIPIMKDYKMVASLIPTENPKCRFLSGLTGIVLETKAELSAQYWTNHLRNTVQFSKAVGMLLNEDELKCRHFIEIGPQPILSDLVRENRGNRAELVLCPSLDRSSGDDLTVLLESLSRLSVSWNGNIDWRRSELTRGTFQKIDLPHYPFQRKRHWIPSAASEPAAENK